MTLASAHAVGQSDDVHARTWSRAAHAPANSTVPRNPWWRWFDFDSKVLAQVWFICSAQIIIFVVGGLVIHATASSPY